MPKHKSVLLVNGASMTPLNKTSRFHVPLFVRVSAYSLPIGLMLYFIAFVVIAFELSERTVGLPAMMRVAVVSLICILFIVVWKLIPILMRRLLSPSVYVRPAISGGITASLKAQKVNKTSYRCLIEIAYLANAERSAEFVLILSFCPTQLWVTQFTVVISGSTSAGYTIAEYDFQGQRRNSLEMKDDRVPLAYDKDRQQILCNCVESLVFLTWQGVRVQALLPVKDVLSACLHNDVVLILRKLRDTNRECMAVRSSDGGIIWRRVVNGGKQVDVVNEEVWLGKPSGFLPGWMRWLRYTSTDGQLLEKASAEEDRYLSLKIFASGLNMPPN